MTATIISLVALGVSAVALWISLHPKSKTPGPVTPNYASDLDAIAREQRG
jgi:hypothetical protein